MTDYHTRLLRRLNSDKKDCYTCDHADHNHGLGYFKCAALLEKRQRTVRNGKCSFWKARIPTKE